MRPSNESKNLQRWIRGRPAKTVVLLSALLAIAPEAINESSAAFTLNWQRDYTSEGASFVNNDAYVVCNMSYLASANCGGGWGGDVNLSGAHIDGTAFLQEQLSLGGQTYYHVIVGDYTKDSMAQEMFIKTGSNTYNSMNMSSSLMDNTNPTFNMDNPYDSTSSKTGTGSGNPNNVIIHQLINDAGTYQEFLKDSFTQKPYMSETISDAQMSAVFSMDMRSKTYSDPTPISLSNVVNTVTLLGPTRFNTQGDANVQSQQDEFHLTAGAFTYTNGSGNGGSGGTYTYTEPFINFSSPMNINYAGYCDPAQNPNWSGKGACVNGSGTGGGWGRAGW